MGRQSVVTKLRILLITLVLLTAFGNYVSATTYNVQFSLKDALTGQSLSGVTVKENDTVLGIINDGDILQLENGTHTLTFEKSGYETVTQTIDVQDNMTVTIQMTPIIFDVQATNIELTQDYTQMIINVTVTNTGNQPIQSVNVSISISGPASASELYEVSQLDPGQSASVVHTYTPPQAGQYTVTATVDPDNNIAEQNEQDNTVVGVIYFLRGRNVHWGATTFWLVDEYETDLKQITASSLDDNMNTIGSTVITTTTTDVTLPTNAAYLVLRSDVMERYIYLPGLTGGTLAFASNASTEKIRTAQIFISNKELYDVLTVKTIDGKIVARYNLTDFTELSFTGVIGRTYIFELEKDGAVAYTQSASISNTLEYITIIPPGVAVGPIEIVVEIVNIDAKYDADTGVIIGNFTSQNPLSGNITIELYVPGTDAPIDVQNVAEFTNQTFVEFAYTLPEGIESFAYAKIIAETNKGTYIKSILGTEGVGALIPEEIFPNGLRIIIVSALGLFALVRLNIELSAMLTAVLLTLSRMIGFVKIEDQYVVLICALAVSMFIFTRIRGEE